MSFPSHIAVVLNRYGVLPETKAALFELYVTMGNDAIESFADLIERTGAPQEATPEDVLGVRRVAIERFLRRTHPRWLEGRPTASLWHPRTLEGRAAGLAAPLGMLGGADANTFTRFVEELTLKGLDEGQSIPQGILILSRNAHFGGRIDTISFDVVAADFEDALAIAQADGQQHTLPGSVGETSGTLDVISSVALLWETQPNVLKPSGERNRSIAKIYRRHRNWHLVTLVAAIAWLRKRNHRIFILRGEALGATHEVNPDKPVSPMIVALHNGTVRRAVDIFGATLVTASEEDKESLLETSLMNRALRKLVQETGAGEAIWRLEMP